MCMFTQVEAGQCVGALPLLLMSRLLDIIHHQRNPTSKYIHPDEGTRAETETGESSMNIVSLRAALTTRLCSNVCICSTVCIKNF